MEKYNFAYCEKYKQNINDSLGGINRYMSYIWATKSRSGWFVMVASNNANCLKCTHRFVPVDYLNTPDANDKGLGFLECISDRVFHNWNVGECETTCIYRFYDFDNFARETIKELNNE